MKGLLYIAIFLFALFASPTMVAQEQVEEKIVVVVTDDGVTIGTLTVTPKGGVTIGYLYGYSYFLVNQQQYIIYFIKFILKCFIVFNHFFKI